MTITGRPARFEGRGLGLTGANINLNRGANRLWIDGPGQMDVLPLPAGPQGQTPAPPGTLTVDWQRRMEFDGRTAQFEEGVVATAGQQQLQTQTMTVQLQWPISFSQPNVQGTPPVEEIRCLGGVSMEQRSFDQQQQLTSHDRMEVTDLAVNILTGALNGGPGWLNSVRRGSDNPLGNPLRRRRRCHCWLVQQCRRHGWTSQPWHPPKTNSSACTCDSKNPSPAACRSTTCRAAN